MTSSSDVPDWSGKAAEIEPIVDAIHNALERLGFEPEVVLESNNLSWDDPDDRRLVREQFADDQTDEMMLSGFGPDGFAENAKDDCGNPHPFICDSCYQALEFGRTCSMSVCSRCAAAWCVDRGIKKTAKFRRIRTEKEYNTPANVDQYRHHLAISPSLDWFYLLAKAGLSRLEALDLSKKISKRILKELRAQGILIEHSFRGALDDGSLKEESDDWGLWKERVLHGRDWWGDVRDELAWMPHYHGIVASDWIEVKGIELDRSLSEVVEDETGWTISRIERDGISLEHDSDVAAALTYSLSHANIDVRDDGANRSRVWEVGSFQGEAVKSLKTRPQDYDLADGWVRDCAYRILGVHAPSSKCGTTLPSVEDPDALAAKIIEELFPGGAPGKVHPHAVLKEVADGNLKVSVSTTSGGGGDVTVRDAFGAPIENGWSAGAISLSDPPTFDGAEEPVPVSILDVDDDQEDDDHECSDDCEHDDEDQDSSSSDGGSCDGTLIPLEVARENGLLEDEDQVVAAPYSDQALEADREWPDDLDPWRARGPGDRPLTVSG